MGEIERWLTDFKKRSGLDDEAEAQRKSIVSKKEIESAMGTLKRIGQEHAWETCPRCEEDFWVLGPLRLCGNCDPSNKKAPVIHRKPADEVEEIIREGYQP